MSDTIINVVNKILDFLPTDPLQNYLNELSVSIIANDWIAWLNWFFPVHQIIIVLNLWISAVLIYKVVKLFIDGFSSFGGSL